MIEFHLDTHSGLAPYLQIVQQVKHALRLGFLEVGDTTADRSVRRWPELAVDPNTVLGACESSERGGLSGQPTPGAGRLRAAGTFRRPLSSHAALGRSPGALAPESALRRAGRGEYSGALPPHVSKHRGRRGGNGVSEALETTQLGKRYGRVWGLENCSLTLAAGRVGALVGPDGAGDTTLSASRLQVSCHRRSVRCASSVWTPRHQAREGLPRVGFVAQDYPLC